MNLFSLFNRDRTGFESFMTDLTNWCAVNPGRVPSKKSDEPVEAALAEWAYRQQTAKHKDQAARRARIDELLGPDAFKDAAARQARWEDRRDVYAKFLADHGREPNYNSDDRDEKLLSKWLTDQRRRHGSGVLLPERITALEEIDGHVWAPRSTSWTVKLDRYREHLATRGPLPLTPHHTDQDIRVLRNWLVNQRAAYHAGSLSPERVAALEQVPGHSWNGHEASWASHLTDVETFMEEFAATPRQSSPYEEEMFLGGWLARQRALLRRGELAPDRLAQLDSLPRPWFPGRPVNGTAPAPYTGDCETADTTDQGTPS